MSMDAKDRAFYQVCTCIRIDCWHEHGKCDEPPRIRGGICSTCHSYVAPPKCPTCGQAMPREA